MSRFERARRIADAVLFEGYVLYPYRASAPKNQFRWAFGVLAPQSWSEAGGCEPWWLESQSLVQPRGALRIEGRLRFLQVESRRVEQAVGLAFEPVESLEADGRLWVSFDEGAIREFDFSAELADASGGERVIPFEAKAGEEVVLIRSGGAVVGRVLRERAGVVGRLRVALEPMGPGAGTAGVSPAPPEAVGVSPPGTAHGPHRLRIRVENTTSSIAPGVPRDEAVAAGCIATHLLLSVSGGGFVSLIDPPAWARAAAASCRNERTWPVLAGEPGCDDLLLSAPIILYDHPQIAPESPGDFFDATEIDELLTLRTATLTPQEKREARATDPRSAAIIDRIEQLPREVLARLHGAIRGLEEKEMVPRQAGSRAPHAIGPGSRVRLRPGTRRADAQDLLFAGMAATVREVRPDVDGRVHLAVTIDGDPAVELNEWYGRYHYYELDEVELIAPAQEASP